MRPRSNSIARASSGWRPASDSNASRLSRRSSRRRCVATSVSERLPPSRNATSPTTDGASIVRNAAPEATDRLPAVSRYSARSSSPARMTSSPAENRRVSVWASTIAQSSCGAIGQERQIALGGFLRRIVEVGAHGALLSRISPMALVRLRGPLKRLAGDRSEHAIEGGSVGELLAELERANPAAKGWILDERGVLRRHINVFVNGELGAQDTRVRRRRPDRRAAGDLRRTMTELLVGTKKGLFVLEGEPGSTFEPTARAFAGDPVEYALRDPRSGRVLASVTSPFYGPKIFYADDPAGEWEQAEGVELPDERRARARARLDGRDRRGRRDGLRGRRPGRAVREPRRRRAVRAQPRAVDAPDAAATGSPARAGCACTRSPPGRASRTGWRSRSPPPACG